jgi:hypothetical protein
VKAFFERLVGVRLSDDRGEAMAALRRMSNGATASLTGVNKSAAKTLGRRWWRCAAPASSSTS